MTQEICDKAGDRCCFVFDSIPDCVTELFLGIIF